MKFNEVKGATGAAAISSSTRAERQFGLPWQAFRARHVPGREEPKARETPARLSLAIISAILLVTVVAGNLAAAEPITVTGMADSSQLVPVSLEGYSGEVLSALRFDLEVAGFKVTGADEAVLESRAATIRT